MEKRMNCLNSSIPNKYKEYANDVVNGKINACKYIKEACERYLDYFNKYEFREDRAEKVIKFISMLKHFVGKHNGKPFLLLPYQKWIIYNIFGFYYPNTNKRVINYVYLELARKNGKSAFAAAISLYMLCADGENGSEVEFVANSAKQAKISFTMASNFLSSIDKNGKHFQRYRDSIKFDERKSILQILSSDASGNDGYNSYCFVLDECHEQKDSRLWDVMCSSQGMRENSLAMITTTAGFNLYGFCYNYRRTCTEILSGLKKDDSQFVAIYTMDDDDDWSDSKNWIKSNPSLGVTVNESYLQQQIEKAKNNTSLEVGIRTKNLNQWISNDLLMDATEKVDLDKFKESTCYIGVDLASVSDLTAVSVMIPIDGKFYFKTKYYLPQSALKDNSNCELYKDWKRKGYLTITDGNVTDYDYLLSDIIKVSNKLFIDKIAYDAYNATQWAINATAQGLPLEPYSQALWSFNRPTKEFERLIKSGRVVIDDNPITRWCFSNVVLKRDFNENIKPTKLENQQKIDGTISMIESLGIYLQQPQFNNEVFAV